MSAQKQFSRTVQVTGPGTLGSSIPARFVDEFDVEAGDELTIENVDWENGRITFRV